MMTATAEDIATQQFGQNRVCEECGIAKDPDAAFSRDSVVCKTCVPKVLKRREASISIEEHRKNEFSGKLRELRKSGEPQVVNGIRKALDILGESPQEVAAKCVVELRDPGKGRADLSPEQLAALPVDYKVLHGYLRMLQEAQVIHDKQLEGHNPFEDMSADELRSVVLKGTIDQCKTDRDLRMQLIRAFSTACSTFFEEVMEVAQEQAGEQPSVRIIKPSRHHASALAEGEVI